MSALRRTLSAALLTAAALAAPLAQAGRSCEVRPPEAISVQRAMVLAEHTAKRLDESGAQVVVVARVGQNLARYGQHYSHLAFAYRDGERWRVLHKLNQCATAESSIYRQGLGEFFLDDLYEYEAGFVVLRPELQAQLLPVLKDNLRATRLHKRAYNMVAYPWALTYQQSNQWALETLAMAADPAVTDRTRAQAWLQLHDYQPSTLRLDALTRLGARIGSANVAFDDHPNAKRFSDRIETVTVDSIFRWLETSGYGGLPTVVR